MKAPIFRPAAAAEVDEAFRWYEGRRTGLGEEFLSSLRATLDSIVESPKMYPVIHRDTRRALIDRFPYGVHYRLIGEHVVVVACFHAKRDPKQWQSRR